MLRRGIFHHLEELHDVIQGLALGAVGLFGSVAQGDNGHDSLALGDSEQLSQFVGIALVAYLLWRVETLQDLSFQPMADGDIALAEAQRAAAEAAAEADDDTLDGDGGRPQPAEGLSEAVIQEIGKLLHDRCEGQSIQAKHLAARSGYRSYRTFSVAFKQRTGQSVKDWIAEQESALQSNKQ